MIGLACRQFDLRGALLLPRGRLINQRPEMIRRVSRVPTLDGGASGYDGGFVWGDVELRIDTGPLTAAQEESLTYLAEYYGRVRVSTRIGAFHGLLESFQAAPPGGTLIVLVTEKIS